MNRKKVVGPRAWEARKIAQDRLLGEIQQDIDHMKEFFAGVSLHRFVFYLADRELAASSGGIDLHYLSDIHLTYRSRVSQIFREVLEEIRRFQSDETEGNYLLEKLLMWAAGKIAEPHCERYIAQEEEMLKRIYGVSRSSDEVLSE